MGDNNWDIGAVVRSCNINKPNNVIAPSLSLESLNFENDDWNFLDGILDAGLINFNFLPEIVPMDFPIEIINPTTPIPIIHDQLVMEQNDNHQLVQPFQPAQLRQEIFFPPPPPAAMLANVPEVATAPQERIDLQQQLVMWPNVHPTLTLPGKNPLIQTPKRKNQSIKIIYELKQEELTDDTWIWRKIGEKRIKSSPFPRNYYKCNTSNACKAKKQIEKSPNGGNVFLVAYSGEHNHPPPTNHRSLACCATSSKDKLPKGINIVPKELSLNSSASSSSKRFKCSSVADFSIGPTTPTLEIESASPNKNEMERRRTLF